MRRAPQREGTTGESPGGAAQLVEAGRALSASQEQGHLLGLRTEAASREGGGGTGVTRVCFVFWDRSPSLSLAASSGRILHSAKVGQVS